MLARVSRSKRAVAVLGALRREHPAPRSVFGVDFPSAVGLAAGMDKDGVALKAWPALGFGFVEVGTVTAHAQQGKALPDGWFNPGFLVVNKKNIAQILGRQATPASRYAFFAAKADREIANQAKYMQPLSKAN